VARAARARRATDFQVLRYVPGASAIHRLWAGTKIVSLGVLSVAIVLRPAWQTAGIVAVLILLGYLFARLPRGIVPHVPRWIWIAVVIGSLLSVYSGGAPHVHVPLLGIRIGLGGLEQWVRFTVIGVEVLAMAGLIGWTTPMADFTPALGRLARPLRWVRVPVDELVGTIGLSIRCLPLLLDEARVLAAARRARRPPPRGFQGILEETEHTVFAALSNALRRSRELAEAIEARGGVPTVAPETHRLSWTDTLALVVTAACLAGIGLVS
jgi:energy-coupling factor transporter transmembrane protein EcfT